VGGDQSRDVPALIKGSQSTRFARFKGKRFVTLSTQHSDKTLFPIFVLDKAEARAYFEGITEEGGGPEKMSSCSRPREVAEC
jgi:hypothetical protein